MNLTVESGSKVLLKTGHLKPVEEGHIKAELTALRDIPANEEITINYNGAPEDKSPLWNAEEIKWIE